MASKKKRYVRPKHPMQPVVWDGAGVIRFMGNPIVRFLVDWGRDHGMSLNDLTMISASSGWTKADWSHFSQLHSYSVSGWGDLSYASDAEYAEAMALGEALLKAQPRDPKRKKRAALTKGVNR